MASKSIVDFVAATLASSWTATPVIDANTTSDTPTDGSSFLTVQYPTARETFIGMASPGSRAFREEGTVRFVLSVPRTSGQGAALAWIETLRDLFRAKTIDVGAGGAFREASPAVNADGNDKGVYWVMAFVAAYYFDALK